MRASIEPRAKAIALRRTSTYGSSARGDRAQSLVKLEVARARLLELRVAAGFARGSRVREHQGHDGRQGRERLEQVGQRREELDVQGSEPIAIEIAA